MFHYGHQRKRARTATGSRQLSLGSASPPLPGMPDAGEPRVHGGAAALGNKLRHCDQPPMYPGMRSHLKPQYFDDPDAQAVVVLQHPAEQLRTVQQLLITCVSIAMMAPRERR